MLLSTSNNDSGILVYDIVQDCSPFVVVAAAAIAIDIKTYDMIKIIKKMISMMMDRWRHNNNSA